MIVPSNVTLVVQITVRVSSLQVNSAFGRRLQSAGNIGVIAWMNKYFIVSVFCFPVFSQLSWIDKGCSRPGQ